MKFVGEYLREERKKKKITLTTVSNELKISFGFLDAIENDEFSKTPGGVYTIGFLKAYSEYLKLDSNKIVEKYKYKHLFLIFLNLLNLPSL